MGKEVRVERVGMGREVNMVKVYCMKLLKFNKNVKEEVGRAHQ